MTNTFKGPLVGSFILGECIGKGNSSTVRLAIHKTAKSVTAAIKVIKKSYLDEYKGRRERIKREVAIMKLVDHPYILKLYDFQEDQKNLYLTLEYSKGGELYTYIVQHEGLAESESLRLLGQIVKGLEYLHGHGICHRDLKPENLLLDQYKNIKIADFGFAQTTRTWEDKLLKTNVGSPHYTAPEIISCQAEYDGRKSDIWSIGIILYAMCTGILPFDDPNYTNLLKKIVRARYEIPNFVSPVVSDLISRMVTKDIEARMKVSNIRAHPAFKFIYPEMYAQPDVVLHLKETDLDNVDGQKYLQSPWDNGNNLDEEIVEDLQSLGWGDIKDLRKILMFNKLKKK